MPRGTPFSHSANCVPAPPGGRATVVRVRQEAAHNFQSPTKGDRIMCCDGSERLWSELPTWRSTPPPKVLQSRLPPSPGLWPQRPGQPFLSPSPGLGMVPESHRPSDPPPASWARALLRWISPGKSQRLSQGGCGSSRDSRA